MKASLNKCPVCGEDLIVARYRCEGCDTSIEGRFENSAFPGLNSDQIEFVKTFVRCEGRINRMEDELNLSYPSIRNLLQDVIRAISAEKRRLVIDDLDSGKISADDAARLLRGEEK
jgi:hypothetical protein